MDHFQSAYEIKSGKLVETLAADTASNGVDKGRLKWSPIKGKTRVNKNKIVFSEINVNQGQWKHGKVNNNRLDAMAKASGNIIKS
eukprot:325083-Amphidinium_carterae.1